MDCSRAHRVIPMLQTTLLLAPLAALTQTASRTVPLQSGPDLTWLVGVVGALVLSIAALAYGFRRVVVGSIRTRAMGRDLAVVDVLPLGGKRQLAVVRCYDRTFALGLGEKSVDLVAELDHAAVEADREEAAKTRDEAFKARLESAKQRLLGAHEFARGLGRGESRDQPVPRPPLERHPIETGEVEPRAGASKEFVA